LVHRGSQGLSFRDITLDEQKLIAQLSRELLASTAIVIKGGYPGALLDEGDRD
jgi:hypothetical protein